MNHFQNLYLRHMMYISYYRSKTYWAARCLKISDRSFQCQNLCYARPCSFLRRTAEDSIAAPVVTRVILRLFPHILIGSKAFISRTDTFRVTSSHVHSFVYFYSGNVEIAVFFDPGVSRSVHRSDLIALTTGDIKKMASIRPPKVGQEIFIL